MADRRTFPLWRGNLDDTDEEADRYRFSKQALRAKIEQLINACPPVFQQIAEQTGLDFFEIEKSLVPLQDLVLLDAKAKRTAIPHEGEAIDAPTDVSPVVAILEIA